MYASSTNLGVIKKLLAATAVALTCSYAFSQVSQFSSDGVTVIDAKQFLNEASGKLYGATLQPLVLTPQATAAAVALANGDWRARVFTLPQGKARPDPYDFFDPCFVYFSSVIGKHSQKDRPVGSQIVFGSLGIDWLHVVRDKPPGSARHLIVFERVADGRSVQLGPELFRMEKGPNRDRYFDSGFTFEVTPDKDYSNSLINQVAEQIEKVTKEAIAAAKNNSPGHKCYRVQIVRATEYEGEEKIAYLEDCEADALAL